MFWHLFVSAIFNTLEKVVDDRLRSSGIFQSRMLCPREKLKVESCHGMVFDKKHIVDTWPNTNLCTGCPKNMATL